MRRGIVIVTWSGGKPQLDLLMLSLRNYKKYPFYVVFNDAGNAPVTQLLELQKDVNLFATYEDKFECGALACILENTDLDEFILIQDTFEILNTRCLDMMFENYPDQSVALSPSFAYFFGKFRREGLLKLQIPNTSNKYESIRAEQEFTREYMNVEPTAIFDENFVNPAVLKYGTEEIEFRWGRPNLITKNRYVIKRQGTWTS